MDVTATKAKPDRFRTRSVITNEVDEMAVSIDETTELRWFFEGKLPTAVLDWFAPDDMIGLSEHRSDSYRIGDHVDVGVKRRFGSKLELKRRQGPPESFVMPNGSCGQLERWKRWSPADEHVGIDEDTRWIDVEKAIVKRRFDALGQELPITETTRDAVGQGCDAEIVAVSIEGRSAWSVAFSAFGPHDTHQALLRVAADSLLGDASNGWKDRLTSAMSCGYPEWLISIRADEGQNN